MDELVCSPSKDDLEGVQGASGVWRIKSRVVKFTARVGDEKIMEEFE
jgi:hypothetical protein